MVRNEEEVGANTEQQRMEKILRERKLHRLGLVIWMDHQRTSHNKHCTERFWESARSTKDKRERHVQERCQRLGLICEEAEAAPSTDSNGVGVWPNASTWTRVESRSKG